MTVERGYANFDRQATKGKTMANVLIEWCSVHNARFGDWSDCDRPSPTNPDDGDSKCKKTVVVVIPVEESDV